MGHFFFILRIGFNNEYLVGNSIYFAINVFSILIPNMLNYSANKYQIKMFIIERDFHSIKGLKLFVGEEIFSLFYRCSIYIYSKAR